MVNQHIDLDARELLSLVHNALNKTFFQVSRTQAKQQFQAIANGDLVPLMKLELHSGDTFNCLLGLDFSEFVGNINFSIFREAVASHLYRISQALRKGEQVNLFKSDTSSEVIFHHPGIIENDGQFNVLVSGIEQKEADTVCIKLLFLNPTSLAEAASSSFSDE